MQMQMLIREHNSLKSCKQVIKLYTCKITAKAQTAVYKCLKNNSNSNLWTDSGTIKLCICTRLVGWCFCTPWRGALEVYVYIGLQLMVFRQTTRDDLAYQS